MRNLGGILAVALFFAAGASAHAVTVNVNVESDGKPVEDTQISFETVDGQPIETADASTTPAEQPTQPAQTTTEQQTATPAPPAAGDQATTEDSDDRAAVLVTNREGKTSARLDDSYKDQTVVVVLRRGDKVERRQITLFDDVNDVKVVVPLLFASSGRNATTIPKRTATPRQPPFIRGGAATNVPPPREESGGLMNPFPGTFPGGISIFGGASFGDASLDSHFMTSYGTNVEHSASRTITALRVDVRGYLRGGDDRPRSPDNVGNVGNVGNIGNMGNIGDFCPECDGDHLPELNFFVGLSAEVDVSGRQTLFRRMEHTATGLDTRAFYSRDWSATPYVGVGLEFEDVGGSGTDVYWALYGGPRLVGRTLGLNSNETGGGGIDNKFKERDTEVNLVLGYDLDFQPEGSRVFVRVGGELEWQSGMRLRDMSAINNFDYWLSTDSTVDYRWILGFGVNLN